MSLREETCLPCQEGNSSLSTEELAALQAELPGWDVKSSSYLYRKLQFPDFKTALAWVNSASSICEEQGHHANFGFGWGYVDVEIFTHKINGLTRADAVLAAKLDAIAVAEAPSLG